MNTKPKTPILILTPLLSTLATAPCIAQAAADAAAQTVAQPQTKSTATARDEPTDAQITDAVEDELLLDAAVPSTRIDVSTVEGIVTLTGSVDSLLAKERAARLAQAVRRVRAVVNQIDVADGSRTNRSVRHDVDNALLLDPATDSLEINVDVTGDQHVTLRGTVDSYAERNLAETVAKGVRGVRGFSNLIAVDYATERLDSEIKEDIEGRLRWDRFVDDGMISVATQDGKVTLTGIVGSAREKQEAQRCCWVAGVEGVDANDLDVERWARDEDLRKGKYVVKSEEELRAAVEDAMLYDPRVSSFEVDTEVDGRAITLRGTVDNLKAKRAAEQDAKGVVGVWRVDNRIKVRPGDGSSDASIREDVSRALLRDPWVERYEFLVDVNAGVVDLIGTVDSHFDKARADDVAARVPGVIAVDNNLVVDDPTVYAYDPYIDYWYSPTYHDWYWVHDPVLTSRSDKEIRQDIEDELWWSPFVDSDEVDVRVDGGIATLTGAVDSWSESESAVENALEGGAVHVVNDLSIGGDDSQ